nr:hypothetical protein [Nanoarchaeum sp.]
MKIYRNRAALTLKYARGDILEIGCVGMGENDVFGGHDFIFARLKKKANKLVGIDINEQGVKELVSQGFDVKTQDAQEKYNLKQKFDTVISEENIEHISNLKTYLDNVHAHLKDDGLFLVTTPNAMCLDFMLQTLIWRKPRVNQYHTHYHTTDTIKYLLESNGFKVVKIKIIHAINWKSTNLGGKIMWFLLRLFPSRLGRTIFVIAKKK